MATLYVENVPKELYSALRERARAHGKSIAAEVIGLLERHVPTAKELARRRRFLQKALRLSARKPSSAGPFPTTEQMARQDRRR